MELPDPLSDRNSLTIEQEKISFLAIRPTLEKHYFCCILTCSNFINYIEVILRNTLNLTNYRPILHKRLQETLQLRYDQ